MKLLSIILIILFPLSVAAADMYDSLHTESWNSYAKVKTDVSLKSKYIINKKDVQQIRHEYVRTRKRFKDFMGVSPDTCFIGKLDIRIISLSDLSNRTYFPYEGVYSDSDGLVLGRYFGGTNTLYLVPKAHHYNWNKSLSHELMHHILDECSMSTGNPEKEHKLISKFEKKYFGDFL